MQMKIELTEQDLRRLVYADCARILGEVNIKPEDVIIEVKSKQNYKSEWEPAAFRATVDVRTA